MMCSLSEPDILEWEVKWALGSTAASEASGGDRVPAELFQHPERWCYSSATLTMSANLENPGVARGLEKVDPHPSSQERQPERMFRLPDSCTPLSASKVCSKFSKLGFSITWTGHFRCLAGFRIGRGTRDQVAGIRWVMERTFQKNIYLFGIYLCLMTALKPLTVWTVTNWETPGEMGTSDHLTCLLRNLYVGQEVAVRTLCGQLTGSGLRKAVYCHPVYMTCTQSTSCEVPGWVSHKLESRLSGEMSTASDTQTMPL